MDAQTDFAITIDRAAGLTLDATCAARAAGALIREAIVALERAQQKFFLARNDPWRSEPRDKPRQMELL